MSAYNNCLEAEALAKEILPNSGGIIAIICSVVTLALLPFCAFKYKEHKIPLHPSFVFQLICNNIVFLYIFHCTGSIIMHGRYQFLIRFYSDPCDILTPVWLNMVLFGTIYMYLQAFTLSHFALTTERIRATLYARQYEKEGNTYAFACLFLLWGLTICTNLAIVATAWSDTVFSKPLVHTTLISSTNSAYLLVQHYILLLIVICTVVLDYMVFIRNKRFKKRADDYSLSRSYQISENIVTLKFILPLDIAFALFFLTHLTCAVILRSMKASVSQANFHAIYDTLYNLVHVHSLVTLLIFLRCAKYFKAKPLMIKPDKHRVMYFRQLQTQWS